MIDGTITLLSLANQLALNLIDHYRSLPGLRGANR
jgi:hypothetical protein